MFGVKDETTWVVSQRGRYVGEVSICPAANGGGAMGLFCKGCKGWHGYTYTSAIPGAPYVNIHGESRAEVAGELKALREKWLRIVAASKF
ncbi:hypothetical protein [Streptomyces sp. NPDC047990]|uniref:hypothetical protein n=1 Tax=Streptomyces sp. NPDC047990 TaxID=3365496 RepID=UPI0037122363